ncbi:uncharacterized protein AKAW2_10441A [Aspergillus luchuensis]|uniref:Uncharacterized protein n=1 Tax=Aspergillus kawachii TaxID=1069201 RepID=A0A7R7ZSR7_ASPKA|nr:uncharacterized protein AKAW2_10441A [Aspergillus luchuensis]BCR93395.1 hypothetical protein AKAW2_10441A [Aspergillus luchuensis]
MAISRFSLRKRLVREARIMRTPMSGQLILNRKRTLSLHLEGNLINISPHPQQVPTSNFACILVTNSAFQQLSDQVRIFGHVLESTRNSRDTVKIASHSNMIESNQVSNVHYVVHYVLQSCILWIKLRQVVRIVGSSTRNKVWGEVDHHNRVTLFDQLQNIVRDVAGMGADRVRGAVTEHHRSAATSPIIFSSA